MFATDDVTALVFLMVKVASLKKHLVDVWGVKNPIVFLGFLIHPKRWLCLGISAISSSKNYKSLKKKHPSDW